MLLRSVLQILSRESVQKVADILRRRPPRQEPVYFLNITFERRLLRVLIIGKPQRQAVVCLNVELPKQIFLPGREDFIVDCLHIRVGQQTQHPQDLQISDQIGELLNNMLVAEIAPHDDLRHLEVILDDKHYFLGLIRRQLQFVENDLHDFGAWVDMITFFMTLRFADIMEQERA